MMLWLFSTSIRRVLPAGYTGHQPHSAPSGSPSAMTNPQHAAQPQHRTPQSHSNQQVAASAGGGSPAATAGTRDAGSSAGAAAIGQPQRHDAGSPAMVAGYPQTASYYSTAGSRVSSPPRYFCDGVEVLASQVSGPCLKQKISPGDCLRGCMLAVACASSCEASLLDNLCDCCV